MSLENPHFLRKYKVDKKPETKQAAEKQARLDDDQSIKQEPDKRIQAYVDRLEHIFLNEDPEVRARNIAVLKPKIYDNTVIKEEDFPESHFEYQKEEMKRRGISGVEFTEEDKQKEIQEVQEKQRKSLEAWIDHLTSDDLHYPPDIKFFVIQGVLRMGAFDKDNYRFANRLKSSTAPFYQIDHEALSMTMGALEAVHHGGDTSPYHAKLLDLIKRNKSFGHMYAEAMRHLDQEADKDKALEIIDGQWRVFKQGSDPQEMVDAFHGKRAYLCLGNIGDAKGYLEQGDVEVYFSNNRAGQAIVPRVAIATHPDGGAYEMRGTYNANEDIDPYIADSDVIKKKLAELPNGQEFAKRDADMGRMTEIYSKCFKVDKKTKEVTFLNPDLTKDDLTFLYEINSNIEGFGYNKDPRIAEVRQTRNPIEDMSIMLECTPDQIATSADQINENTKAYVGPLTPGIFTKLTDINHIYTSFPEGKKRIYDTEIGGVSKEELETRLKQVNINISDKAKYILRSPDFTVQETAEEIRLIRLTVKDLGLPQGATTDEIYARAQELGLELCPAEVGPHLRLQYTDQPMAEWLRIGMKQITGSGGNQDVFFLERREDGLWLYGYWARPGNGWVPANEFVFRLRK